MAKKFWLRIDQRVQGPFTSKQLRQLAADGKLEPIHHVSADQERWVLAREIKGLSFPNTASDTEKDRADDKVVDADSAAAEPDWYYKVMGEEVGPVSTRALRKLARGGEITRDTMVKNGQNGDWISAAREEHLFTGERLPEDVTRTPATGDSASRIAEGTSAADPSPRQEIAAPDQDAVDRSSPKGDTNGDAIPDETQSEIDWPCPVGFESPTLKGRYCELLPQAIRIYPDRIEVTGGIDDAHIGSRPLAWRAMYRCRVKLESDRVPLIPSDLPWPLSLTPLSDYLLDYGIAGIGGFVVNCIFSAVFGSLFGFLFKNGGKSYQNKVLHLTDLAHETTLIVLSTETAQRERRAEILKLVQQACAATTARQKRRQVVPNKLETSRPVSDARKGLRSPRKVRASSAPGTASGTEESRTHVGSGHPDDEFPSGDRPAGEESGLPRFCPACKRRLLPKERLCSTCEKDPSSRGVLVPCPSCGKLSPAYILICPRCAADFAITDVTDQQARRATMTDQDNVYCPSCNKAVKPGSVVCVWCGSSQAADACYAVACLHCGGEVSVLVEGKGSLVDCPHCGNTVTLAREERPL